MENYREHGNPCKIYRSPFLAHLIFGPNPLRKIQKQGS